MAADSPGSFQAMSYTARWVNVAAGAVLLTAGTLKLILMLDAPSRPDPFFASPFMATAATAGELALGMILLSGWFVFLARVAAIFTFAIFLSVSIARELNRESSCGCFGAFAVPPWVAAVGDTTLLLLLICSKQPLSSLSAISRRTAAAVAIILLVGGPLLWGVVQTVQARRSERLAASPMKCDLGMLPRGGSAKAAVLIANETDKDIEVASLRVSCPCLSVTPDRWTLPPGTRIPIGINLDLAEERDFTGRLAITVTSLSPAGQSVFQLTVTADVGR